MGQFFQKESGSVEDIQAQLLVVLTYFLVAEDT